MKMVRMMKMEIENQINTRTANIIIELVREITFGDYYLPPNSTKMCQIPLIDMGNGNQCYHKTIVPSEQTETYECKPAPTLEETKNANTD